MLNSNIFNQMQFMKSCKIIGLCKYIFNDVHIINTSCTISSVTLDIFNKLYQLTVSDCRLEVLLMCPLRNLKLLKMNFSLCDKCCNPWPDFLVEIFPNLVRMVSKKHFS